MAKLRQMKKVQAQAMWITAACKRLGIADQRFDRCRSAFEALRHDQAQRLTALEAGDA